MSIDFADELNMHLSKDEISQFQKDELLLKQISKQLRCKRKQVFSKIQSIQNEIETRRNGINRLKQLTQ